MTDWLDAVQGANRVTIENFVAEIGVDMNQFPWAEHLASWAGLCRGNEESAGLPARFTVHTAFDGPLGIVICRVLSNDDLLGQQQMRRVS